MGDEEEFVSLSYRGILLGVWKEIMEYSEAFHEELLLHNDDDDQAENYNSETGRLYIVKMCRLWTELLPKVVTYSSKGSKTSSTDQRFKEIAEDFLAYEDYVMDPTKFTEKQENGKRAKDEEEKIFKLEKILRYIVEKLKITEI